MKLSLAISLISTFFTSPAIAADDVKSLGWLLHYVSDMGGGRYCFNDVLATLAGGPTTVQLISMFSSNVVEGNDGRVFALNPVWGPGVVEGSGGFPIVAQENEAKGLYEIIDEGDACVTYSILLEDDALQQIVYGGNWVERLEVIGADSDGKIWGYYQDGTGQWAKKQTRWGDARPGTLSEVMNKDGSNSIVGVSKDGRRFGLWGNFENFNYSRHDVYCSSRPAGMGDWSGKWSQFRGTYCPTTGDNRLMKYTWRGGGGSTNDALMWEPASSITRLSESSNIYGISPNGNLLTLVKNGDVNNGGSILAVPIHPSLLHNKPISALGGIGDDEGDGIYVTAGGKLYSVYWEGTCDALSYNWEAEEVPLLWDKLDDIATCESPRDMVFANYDGETYFLYGSPPVPSLGSCWHAQEGHYTLYRLQGKTAEAVQHGYPSCNSGNLFGC